MGDRFATLFECTPNSVSTVEKRANVILILLEIRLSIYVLFFLFNTVDPLHNDHLRGFEGKTGGIRERG